MASTVQDLCSIGLPSLAADHNFAGPHACANWVLPGKLLAGGYPGASESEAHEAIIKATVEAGVDSFVCLMPNDQLQNFAPYAPIARRLKPMLELLQCPIVDGTVTTDASARSAADTIIRRVLAGNVVYVHCWGGHGRTGTIVSILLGRLFRVQPQVAINFFNATHDRRIRRGGRFPESDAQGAQAMRLAAEPFGEGKGAASELKPLSGYALPPLGSPNAGLSPQLIHAFRRAQRLQCAATAATAAAERTAATELAAATASATRRSRCRGTMLGMALGDALGTAVEFQPPGSFAPLSAIVGGGKFQLLAGQWTDDTSMALCLAESLARCGGRRDAADQLQLYEDWLYAAHLSSNGRFIDVGQVGAV